MIVSTPTEMEAFIAKCRDVKITKPWLMTAEPYKKNRSLAQNRLSFSYYISLGKATGNGTKYERNYCKYTFGIPILMADKDSGFDEFFGNLIDNLEYEQLIDAMEFIEVSRLFKVGQFQDYLLAIEHYAFDNHYPLMADEDLRNEAIVIK